MSSIDSLAQGEGRRDAARLHDGCRPTTPAKAAPVAQPGPIVRSIEELPAPDTKRWVMRRKAEVVAAVRGGLLTLEQACQRYSLSEEEFLSWQRLIDAHGVRALRTTRLQEYRRTTAAE
ncbi:MAG TPA: DUF1153 domain-containing protein [Azospirillaceae bacterium]|nr:DUF1153 domain-containing protein [Azospirillaceae bacterium]